jgi:3-deoxy-7-phosphoheptulonate synthase
MQQNNQRNWTPSSWRNFTVKQQPQYPDQKHLQEVEDQLCNFPPLVSCDEIENLKKELAMVANGQAFLLQGGDCAESFSEFSHGNLKNFFRTIMQMTVALMYGIKKPVVKIGRVAGQYAKPRSQDSETIDNLELPSYRGDIINSIDFNEESRTANPKRLIDSYFHSAASLNYLRSLALGGYGNLIKVNEWNKDFAHSLTSRKSAEMVVENINDFLQFINACGIDFNNIPQITTANFFTSHEALLLNYEQSFTKISADNQKYYNTSAHFLWIGDRTEILMKLILNICEALQTLLALRLDHRLKLKN